MAEKEGSLQDTVDSILEFCGEIAAAGVSDLKSKKSTSESICSGGPLSTLTLRRLCTSLNSSEEWSQVDAESLQTLIERLREHVDSAASVDLYREAKNALLDGHVKYQVNNMRHLRF